MINADENRKLVPPAEEAAIITAARAAGWPEMEVEVLFDILHKASHEKDLSLAMDWMVSIFC